jgi:hypothetical protein
MPSVCEVARVGWVSFVFSSPPPRLASRHSASKTRVNALMARCFADPPPPGEGKQRAKRLFFAPSAGETPPAHWRPRSGSRRV